MFKTRGIFLGKEPSLRARDCVVEKVVPLSHAEFDFFQDNLLEYHDFISDNIDLMYDGPDDTRHCLLVVGEGHEDGILVQSEGYDYARYTALLPHAAAVLAQQEQKFDGHSTLSAERKAALFQPLFDSLHGLIGLSDAQGFQEIMEEIGMSAGEMEAVRFHSYEQNLTQDAGPRLEL